MSGHPVIAFGVDMLIVGGLVIVAVLSVFKSLKNAPNWSIADALSEKADPTPAAPANPPNPNPGGAGAAVVVGPGGVAAAGDPNAIAGAAAGAVAAAGAAAPPAPKAVASSSRVIAFFGMLMLLAMFTGVGIYVLWALFTGRDLQNLGEVTKFFFAAAGLFAPYMVNQLKEAFTAFAK